MRSFVDFHTYFFHWLAVCADSANPNLYGNHLEKENLLNQSNHIEANSYQGPNQKVSDMQVRWYAGDMIYRWDDMQIRWYAGQMICRLDEMQVRWCAGQVIVRWDEMQDKWYADQMICSQMICRSDDVQVRLQYMYFRWYADQMICRSDDMQII